VDAVTSHTYPFLLVLLSPSADTENEGGYEPDEPDISDPDRASAEIEIRCLGQTRTIRRDRSPTTQ
jgi:hypothetical protein